MKRRRYQKGSLQLRKTGKRRMWVLLYYDRRGSHRYHTLGLASEMSKGDAQKAREEFMREVNGGGQKTGFRPPTIQEFLQDIYLPFYRRKWKASTKMTAEQRITQHIVGDLGGRQVELLGIEQLQQFLQTKGDAGLSRSIVDHLRFDLRSIFRMALAEGIIEADPAPALYTPRNARQISGATMDPGQVVAAIAALPRREALMLHLAVLVGMRPGEILALQRKHVARNCLAIEIGQRVYGGVIDDPKTHGSKRKAAIAPETAALLVSWLHDAVGSAPEAYVFTSEAGTPLRPGNVMRRIIRPALAKIGLEWFNFQVARRTHASLGGEAGVDPKVGADQRGHTLRVSMDVYTKSSDTQKAEAARKLAAKVLQMPEKGVA